MSSNSRLTVINGVLAQFGRTPVATVNENDDSTTINTQLDRYLPLYQKSSIDYYFLIKTVTLSSPVIDSPQDENNFAVTFSLPSDFLRIKQSLVGADFEIREPYVLTNTPYFQMDYLSYNSNYSMFPSHFIDAFIYFVAVRLCMPMTRQEDLLQGLKVLAANSELQAASTEFRMRSGRRTLLNPKSRIGSYAVIG